MSLLRNVSSSYCELFISAREKIASVKIDSFARGTFEIPANVEIITVSRVNYSFDC